MDNKKVEYGIDHKDDKNLYRTLTVTQTLINYKGEKDISSITTVKARNRVTDLSMPESENGRVTYTPWKTVETRES